MTRRYSMKHKVQKLLQRDGTQCHYCGRELDFTDAKAPNYRTVDHIKPWSAKEKPNHNLNNLVLCCQDCNVKKGQQSYKEFKTRI